MGLGGTAIGEWLRDVGITNDGEDVELKIEETEEILGDIIGDNLTMAELGPAALDDDQLQEVLESLDFTEDDLALVSGALEAIRPQLGEEAEAEAEAKAAAAAAAAAEERERLAAEAAAAAAAAAAVAANGTHGTYCSAMRLVR